MSHKSFVPIFLVSFLVAPVTSLADTLSPETFSATIGVGDSVTVHKTITIGTVAPTSTLVDVFFLADTTGSMGSAISNVRMGASSIMSSVASLGDVQFAVGEYKDFPHYPWGGPSDFPYRLNQSMTADTSAVQTGINAWSASGGYDGPESGLEGLRRAASDAATGWRTGSERILVWFGDYPSHDSADTAGYPVSRGDALAALNAEGIQVEAVSVGASQLDSDGDATYITSGTGGHLYNGISTGSLASVITDAIKTAYSTYTSVGLDLSALPAGLASSMTPGCVSTGVYDRSVERVFDCDLSFTGVTGGDYSFDIYATVDGGRVASESDHIVVTTGAVSEPGTALLLGLSLLGLAAIRRQPLEIR